MAGQTPIVVLGLMQRAGSNYLGRLLGLHPQISDWPRVPEDYCLHHSHHLVRYIDGVVGSWEADWGPSKKAKDELLTAIGRGILSYFSAGSEGKRPLLKHPTLEGARNLPTLFASARTILMLRDGRDLVTSGRRAFGWDFDWAARHYDRYAQSVQYLSSVENVLVVRFEDLVADQAGTLETIFTFADVDAAAYDFAAAAELPVYGSSDQGRMDEEQTWLYWKPQTKPPAFRPVGRWSSWGSFRKERFKWLAGQALVTLGYEDDGYVKTGVLWYVVNPLLDLVFWPRYGCKLAFQAVYALARRVGRGVWRRVRRIRPRSGG